MTESDGGRNSVFSGTNQLSNSLSKEDPDRNKAISILTQDKKVYGTLCTFLRIKKSDFLNLGFLFFKYFGRPGFCSRSNKVQFDILLL